MAPGTTPDYSSHLDAPSDEAMAKLDDLVEKLHDARRNVALAEAALEDAQNTERDLAERQVPDLMLVELGMEEILTTRGLRVKIKKEIRASMPKDPERRAAAFSWLEETGNGALIKDKFEIAFDRSEHERANAFVEVLEALAVPVPYERKMDLHHQTMLAMLREKLAAGEVVPLELFSAFEQRVAKIVEKK